jgi:hypothetical protein
MLQNNAAELAVGLARTDLSRFGHDFSQIPIHPRVAGAIQTKLAINEPGDEQEQEADRVSEHVMRKQNFEPVKSYEAKLQRKENGDVANSFAPQIVRDVLSSGGRPLEADTRAFMESRFSLDFGNVKIHDNNAAAKSASSINALAYTLGNNIVFNNGQYAPGTEEGQKLLAHELVHVKQQGDGNATNSIQRFSDTDHHIVEEVALGSLFTEDELKSIEQGNMQRDYSQVPAGLNAVLLGTKDQFGGYKRHEHFDNFIFGYPFKAGRFGVGRVLYGAKFKHEFSHPTEDRPPWDFGPKASWFSTVFTVTPSRVFAKSPGKPGFPRAVCTGSNK